MLFCDEVRVIFKWAKEGRLFEGVYGTFSLLASTYLFVQSIAKILHSTRKAVNHPDPLVLRFRLLLSSSVLSLTTAEGTLSPSVLPRKDRKERMYTTFVACPPSLLHKRKRIPFIWDGVCLPSFNAPSCLVEWWVYMWNRNPCECNNGWHGCQLCYWELLVFVPEQPQQNKHRDRDFIFMETTWHRWRETCFMPGPKEIRIRLPQIINKSWATIQSDNMFRSQHLPAGQGREGEGPLLSGSACCGIESYLSHFQPPTSVAWSVCDRNTI